MRDEYHGSGAIWLDNLQCSGYEEDISHCQHDGWGVHFCGRYQHVSISCNSDSNEPGKAARLPIYIRRHRWQAISPVAIDITVPWSILFLSVCHRTIG